MTNDRDARAACDAYDARDASDASAALNPEVLTGQRPEADARLMADVGCSPDDESRRRLNEAAPDLPVVALGPDSLDRLTPPACPACAQPRPTAAALDPDILAAVEYARLCMDYHDAQGRSIAARCAAGAPAQPAADAPDSKWADYVRRLRERNAMVSESNAAYSAMYDWRNAHADAIRRGIGKMGGGR